MGYLLTLHIIAFVSWFAGLFYLPRLFVYHAMTDVKAVQAQFKVMEYKLYTYIMLPAMLLTLASGLGLMVLYLDHNPAHSGWLWLKLILVSGVVMYHFICGHMMDGFKADAPHHSHRFYRYFNEVPTILLILIVGLAVLQPL